MILMTGATGLAGSAIAAEFVRQGQAVRLLVRDRAKAAKLTGAPALDIVDGDMARPDTLGAALDGVERVLMISGPDARMVETQCTFIDAAKAAGVRHIIKFSGLDARKDALFRFVRMHKEVEEHLEASGLRWTHLGPAGFMQVYLREALTIADGVLALALSDIRLSPVDLADVAKVAFLLLRDGGHESEWLPMTGPEALTMGEIAEHVSRAVGRPVRYFPVSPAERRDILLARGVPPDFADALDEQVAERLKGGAESRIDLSTHAAFGIAPTRFAAFAMRHASDFKGERRAA